MIALSHETQLRATRLFAASMTALSALAMPGSGATEAYLGDPVVYPTIPVDGCRGGRAKLYDECGSQVALFNAAHERAQAQGKVLVVSYRAEWCIWCHVFHDYVRGRHTVFLHRFPDEDDTTTYTAMLYERPPSDPLAEAQALATYTEESFVLVHIDAQHAPDGEAVLNMTGAERHIGWGIPFIFSVDEAGHYAAHLNTDVETRRDTDDWFRGYDRAGLLQELTRLNDAAGGH